MSVPILRVLLLSWGSLWEGLQMSSHSVLLLRSISGLVSPSLGSATSGTLTGVLVPTLLVMAARLPPAPKILGDSTS